MLGELLLTVALVAGNPAEAAASAEDAAKAVEL